MIEVTAAESDEMSQDIATALEKACRENGVTILDYDISDLTENGESAFVRITVQPITEFEFNAESQFDVTSKQESK